MELAPAARRGAAAVPRRRARRHWILAAGGALATASLIYWFDPADARFFPKCLFFAATGLACPGCGTTRALHALLHLDVVEAFALNPLLFVLPLVGGLWLASEREGRAPGRSRWVRSVPWLLAALIVAFTVWRNLPGYPFVHLSTGLKNPFVAAVR